MSEKTVEAPEAPNKYSALAQELGMEGEEAAKFASTMADIEAGKSNEVNKAMADINAKLDVEAEAREKSEEHLEEAIESNTDKLAEATIAMQGAVQRFAEASLGDRAFGSLLDNAGTLRDETRKVEARILAQPEVAGPMAAWEKAWLAYHQSNGQAITRHQLRQVQNRALEAKRKAGGIFAGTGDVNPHTDAEGAVVVPSPIRQAIIERAPLLGGVRQLATVVELPRGGGNTLSFPAQTSHAAAAFVGSTNNAVSATATPQLDDIEIALKTVMSKTNVNKFMWSAAPSWAASFYLRELTEAMIAHEDNKFLNGTAATEPKGVLSSTKVTTSGTFEYGKLQFHKTGANGAYATAAAATSSADVLLNVLGDVPAAKRARGAGWIMARSTATKTRQLKDTDGNHIWQQSLIPSLPSTLYGYSVYEDDGVPVIANDSFSVLFAAQGFYGIVQRSSDIMTVIDNLSMDATDTMRMYRQTGGAMLDWEAASAVQFKA